MKRTELDFLAILQHLAKHEVDFIVVGGIGAVLQGAPIATFDLDVVHSREPRNIDKLLAALDTLGATYRRPSARKIKPNHWHLSTIGHQLLMTSFGPLDVLGMIGAGHEYQDLIGQTIEMQVAPHLKVRVLNLPALIKTKEETGGKKRPGSFAYAEAYSGREVENLRFGSTTVEYNYSAA